MLGDILLIEEKHQKAGEAIAEHILAHKKERMIVGISGESGSGKTELAHVISRVLRRSGIIAKSMHVDNYYRILPKERTEWRQEKGVENVVGYEEYDWNRIYSNINDFKAKSYSTMPCVDLLTDQVDMLTTNFAEVDLLLVDGLYAIKSEDMDIRIFIDLDYKDTGKAQKLRGKEPQNEFRMQVLLKEHEMVRALKPSANILVKKDYLVDFL